jgi:hypothetical protein
MKNKLCLTFLSVVLLSLSSCEVIGGIFKAGVWSGILLVVGIIVLIVVLISKAGKK